MNSLSTHPALYSDSMIVDNWKWVWADTPPPGVTTANGMLAQVQFRHRMLDLPCRVYQCVHPRHQWNMTDFYHRRGDGTVRINFRRPQSSVATGQVAAIWKNDWCLGCGIISQTYGHWRAEDAMLHDCAT